VEVVVESSRSDSQVIESGEKVISLCVRTAVNCQLSLCRVEFFLVLLFVVVVLPKTTAPNTGRKEKTTTKALQILDKREWNEGIGGRPLYISSPQPVKPPVLLHSEWLLQGDGAETLWHCSSGGGAGGRRDACRA
jgi:hypothetical protein